jgi:tetratricopeptide (TPR) repeat protein
VTGPQQSVTATSGFAYGTVGADLHIFGDGTPLYVLLRWQPPSEPDAEWLCEMPSRMLNARHALVEFTGRDAEIADLRQWRDSGPRLAARWLHGPGGAGKSRLAAEFAARCERDGWLAVVAVHGPGTVLPPPGSQDLRTDGYRGLLLIIDYADRWPLSHLTWLFSNALLHQAGLPTRVLMLARSPDGWPAVRASLANHQAGTSGQALESLAEAGAQRPEMFAAARDAFAQRYGLADARSIGSPTSYNDPEMGLTLALHMAALVAVDARSRGEAPPRDLAGLTIYLLDREHLHWANLYTDATGRTGPGAAHYATPPEVMDRTVFAAALAGAVNRPTGTAIVRGLDLEERVLDDHRRCYPPSGEDGSVLEPLYPDRLAEDFLALTTPGHRADYPAKGWATSAATTVLGLSAPARPVTFLAEAARRWPHLGPASLFPLLRHSPKLAVDAGSAALTALAAIPNIDMDVLAAIEPLLPPPDRPNVDLDVGAAAVLRRLTPHLLATRDDPREKARALSLLAIRLGHIGELEAALEVAVQALSAWRAFAADRADRLPDLVAALATVAGRLIDVDRPGDALPYLTEGIDRYRMLLAVMPNLPPDMYTPQLSNLLLRQSGVLTDLGRTDEALASASEAMTLFQRDPVRYERQIASASEALAYAHRRAGRHADASRDSIDALTRLRALAREDPARYQPALANHLVSVSEDLTRQRMYTDALQAAEEAVALYRPLERANPGRFGPELTDALRVYGKRAAARGKPQEAVAALEEASQRWERSTSPGRDAQLGSVHYELALVHNQLQDPKAALRCAEESAACYRRVAAPRPNTLADLALSLGYAAKIRHEQRLDPGRALAAAREGLDIFRQLSRTDPQMFGRYVEALTDLVQKIERG